MSRAVSIVLAVGLVASLALNALALHRIKALANVVDYSDRHTSSRVDDIEASVASMATEDTTTLLQKYSAEDKDEAVDRQLYDLDNKIDQVDDDLKSLKMGVCSASDYTICP